MNQQTIAIIAAFTFVLSGCSIGPKAAKVLSANGLLGEITLHKDINIGELVLKKKRRLPIELLSLEEEGLLVRSENKIIQVGYGALRYIKLKHGGSQKFVTKETPEEVKEKLFAKSSGRLQLMSRFPQGVSPALLKELLIAHGQRELIVIR